MRSLILCLVFIWIAVPWAIGQFEEVRITGEFGPAKLSRILQDIRGQYGVRFAYDAGAIDSEETTVSFLEATLEQAMDQLLSETGLTYKYIRRTVVVYQDTESLEISVARPEASDVSWSAIVTDAESSEVLPFAIARVKGTSLGAMADTEGKVTIEHIPSDSCQIMLSYTGYEERTIRLSSPAGKMETIGLRLRGTLLPAAIIEAKSMQLLESGNSHGVQSFSPSDLIAISTNGETDVLRGAQLLPGVSGTNESSNGLIIRGSDPDQAMVQFDDFTVFHLDHFFGSFSAINADAVKQIRIYKGGLDASMGGRVAGVVRITGKEGNRTRPSAQLSLGTLSGSLLLESPVGKEGSLIVAARRSYVDAFATPVFVSLYSTVYRQVPGTSYDSKLFGEGNDPQFFYQDLTAKYTWRSAAGDKLNVSSYLGRDNLVHSFRESERPDGLSARYSDESNWGNAGAGFRWIRERKPGIRSLITCGGSRYTSNYFSTDTIINAISGLTATNYRDDRFTLADMNVRAERTQKIRKLPVTYGAHLNHVRIRNESGINVDSAFKSQGSVFALYLQTELKFKLLTIRPGVRINAYSRTEKVYPEWRFGWMLDVTPTLQIKGSVSRVHQFIHRVRPQSLNQNHSDLWLLSGDAEIPLLRSDQVTAGFGWSKGRWNLDVEGYFKANSGTFEYLRPYSFRSETVDSLTFGSGTSTGLDLLLGFNAGIHHAWLSYSLSKSENEFSQLSERPIPEWYDQRHEVKLYYEIEWKKWEFAITSLVGTGRPYTPVLGVFEIPLEQGSSVYSAIYGDLHSGRLPVYHRVDLAASWKFEIKSLSCSIQGSIFNVYNRMNVRDIRYLGAYDELGKLNAVEQRINMSGIIPSLQLQIRW